MNRYKTWVSQGKYKTLGLQGNKKGVKMILVQDKNTGETVLEPLQARKHNKTIINGVSIIV